MKDCINRAFNMMSGGASAEDIHRTLTTSEAEGGEGLTQAQAYYTYKAAEVILNSHTQPAGGETK